MTRIFDEDLDAAFGTRAIHAGQHPDPVTGAVMTPVYFTSTYAQEAVGAPRLGYEYSRSANPTRDALQECLAALEGGARGLAFASGLAASDALLRTVCRPGDHVVIPDDAYGGTYRLISRVLAPTGLGCLSTAVGEPTGDGFVRLSIPLTHHTLANMIGSNRVTVTRKLRDLQDRGLVGSSRRNSLLVHPSRLQAFVEAAE
jgi:O-acetylhomoserine/O-acetylserine sulfhydrylase-like pyridoxal-dependent enzyme